ncbi:MAG: DUF2085 domain-containing protein [Polyangiaceae bacterium]|nr:DUF2085 domain-containing protein [Polyangiaceae bacterium]
MSAPDNDRAKARAQILAWFRGLLVFVGVFPWILPFARARLPLGDVGIGLDLVFFTMCHRRAPRTLVFDGVLMPLCSRCAGIFLGVALGALIARPILPLRTWRWAFVLSGVLMVADVVTQDLGIHPVWHATRIATGVFVGYLMSIGFFSALARDKVDAPTPGDASPGDNAPTAT